MGGGRLRQRREGGERLGLGLAMNAGGVRIDDEQDAPGLGEVGAHEDGRRPLDGAAAAVDDEAAVSNAAMPIAERAPRSTSSPELAGAVLEALERHQRGPDRERELGARAEPGMGRDGGADVQLVGGRPGEKISAKRRSVSSARWRRGPPP